MYYVLILHSISVHNTDIETYIAYISLLPYCNRCVGVCVCVISHQYSWRWCSQNGGLHPAAAVGLWCDRLWDQIAQKYNKPKVTFTHRSEKLTVQEGIQLPGGKIMTLQTKSVLFKKMYALETISIKCVTIIENKLKNTVIGSDMNMKQNLVNLHGLVQYGFIWNCCFLHIFQSQSSFSLMNSIDLLEAT